MTKQTNNTFTQHAPSPDKFAPLPIEQGATNAAEKRARTNSATTNKNTNDTKKNTRTKTSTQVKQAAAKQAETQTQAAQQTSDQQKSKPDSIRIIIRDAKPPLLARIIQGFMRLICIVLLVCVCAIGIPRLFGVYEFNVLTGSMTPTYPVGTLVFVQPKDPSSIRPGEVVTCIMDEAGDVITHRVVSNNYEDKTITTRGDANNANDGPSLYENVVGVVCFAIPYAGGVFDYVTNTEQGRIVGIGLLLAILALTFAAEGICGILTKQAAKVYQPGSAGQEAVSSVSLNEKRGIPFFSRTRKREISLSTAPGNPPNNPPNNKH